MYIFHISFVITADMWSLPNVAVLEISMYQCVFNSHVYLQVEISVKTQTWRYGTRA